MRRHCVYFMSNCIKDSSRLAAFYVYQSCHVLTSSLIREIEMMLHKLSTAHFSEPLFYMDKSIGAPEHYSKLNGIPF